VKSVEDDLTVTLPVGAIEEFRLPGFGTSGYEWFPKVDDERVVRLTRVPSSPETGARAPVGDSVDEIFSVEALRSGTATLVFELARPWERAAVTRRHTVTIRSEPSR
jgi:predicted secreted protein